MTQVREPTEVVGALVHLLHKRGIRIHQPPNLQHTVDLSRTPPGIEDPLENAFSRDRVEAAVLEGQVVRIADQRDLRSRRDVRLDDLRIGRGPQGVQVLAVDAVSHHEDAWGDGLDAEQRHQTVQVGGGLDRPADGRGQSAHECTQPARPAGAAASFRQFDGDIRGPEDAAALVDQHGHPLHDRVAGAAVLNCADHLAFGESERASAGGTTQRRHDGSGQPNGAGSHGRALWPGDVTGCLPLIRSAYVTSGIIGGRSPGNR